MRRVVFVLMIATLATALGASAAVAAPSTATIDSRAPRLTKQDDGRWTVALGLTNLTDRPLELSAEPVAPRADCAPSFAPPTLAGSEHTSVTATIPASCAMPDNGVRFNLIATPEGGVTGDGAAAPASFEVAAAPKPDDAQTPWKQLLAFPLVLVLALIVLVGGVDVWGPSRTRLETKLPAFGGTWSFRESWASNVTVVGGLITALFATAGVDELLFGEDADQAVALAVLGSAIAVALATAGAMVVLASRDDKDVPTAFGLLSGAALTVAAAGGQLWVGYQVGLKVNIGGSDGWFLGALVLGGGLLAVYTIRSLRQALIAGKRRPAPATKTAVVEAVTTLTRSTEPEEVGDALATLMTDVRPARAMIL